MADAYAGLVAGTSITWTSSGGDKALTATSLANNAAREGVKSGTLIANGVMPEVLECRLESKVASAATTGLELECYFGESDSATAGTNNPGLLTGADAALTTPDEYKLQLNYAGSLVFSNTRGTNLQIQRFLYYPTQPYITPLLVNKTGQALGSTGTDHKLIITPFFRKIDE